MTQRPIEGSDRLTYPPRAFWTLAACGVILIAGIAAWSNSFNGPFIFDDLTAIQRNPTIRHFPAWENFVPPRANSISRRPVLNFTLALNYALSGPGVRGFHAGNLIIHLLAALTLFGVVRRTLAHCRLPIAVEQHSAIGNRQSAIALAVALIWAVHPLLTESVTYLTERAESLMGLLYLLTLYCAIRGASSGHPPPDGRRPSWRWQAAAIAACALGMGAKEVMASAPIVVLLYDRCFFFGSFREALRRRLPFYLGLAATWAILGALLILYPWDSATGAGFGLMAISPWEYARTQPGVLLHYLRLSFWPSPLCLDYSWPIATSARQIIPAAAVIAALVAGTLWALRRAPALGFLGAWFFLILAPTSSFIPILDMAVERRMYLPLAAIVTAVVVAACWLGNRFVHSVTESDETQRFLGRVLAAVALLSAAAALGYRTFERNTDYRDAISIWRDTADQRPGNPRAQNNLGAAYFSAGCPDEAIRCFSRAIELKADYFDAWNNRGAAHTETRQIVEAIGDFDKAIALKPDDAAAYNNRGAAYFDANRIEEAIADYSRAIELLPGYADALENRSSACLRSGRYALAIADCDKAIELRPDHAEAYINRAVGYWKTRQYEKALADVKRFQQLGGRPPPEFVEGLLRLTERPNK